MVIVLMGYMGSGKSTIGRLLSREIGYGFVDFDAYIEKMQNKTVSQIFEEKGEIYFRRLERESLITILDEKDDLVISFGGGTPCYGDNMELIKNAGVRSVYLNVPVIDLTIRLWQGRAHRPLLKHQDTPEKLEEFVRKHLFERSFYYNQAEIKLAASGKSELELVRDLVARLF